MSLKTKIKYICAVIYALLFGALISLLKTVDIADIGPAKAPTVGLASINGPFHDSFGYNAFFYKATQLLGYAVLAIPVVFAAVMIVQFVRRKKLVTVDPELYALCGTCVLMAAVYAAFEFVIVNYRPIIMPGKTEPAASFPSSHTVLAVVVLGSAVLLLNRYVKNKTLCRVLQGVGCALAVFMVVGRLFSGVHWFTDILGGVLISAAILCLFSAVLDTIHNNRVD